MDRFELHDVDPQAITICKRGANGQRFFLKKEHAEGNDLHVFPGGARIVKTADWSSVYCVVAEPGAVENGGLLAPDVEDVWRDEDEIRKAAHRFMENGGLITKMHEGMEPYGQTVESAVALADIDVEGETISKGSWYVAIKPTEEGKELIEKGEFTGISIEGSGERSSVGVHAHGDQEEAVGLLSKLASMVGVNLQKVKAGAASSGTVAKQNEEEDVDDATKQKIEESHSASKEALEKASTAVTAIEALKDTTDQILARLPKENKDGEEEEAKPDDLKKAVEDATEKLVEAAGRLDDIEKSVDKLAEGSSSQAREGEGKVKKSDPLAGLLA